MLLARLPPSAKITSNMNIYLDIDGVILGKDTTPANYAGEFIKRITAGHQVYWLTTHCKGDSAYTISFLSRFLDPETLEIAKKIKPTNWNLAKTEAIDFSAPFLWFDDNIFGIEKQELTRRGVLDRWVEINLSKNPNQLKDLLRTL